MKGPTCVLEFVSNQSTLVSSVRSLARAGRLVFVGYTPELPLALMPHEVVRSELEILGSRANSKQELEDTMSLVAQGKITPVVDRGLLVGRRGGRFRSSTTRQLPGPQRSSGLNPSTIRQKKRPSVGAKAR